MNKWILGARPRTLPASLTPVAVGTAAAVGDASIVAWRVVAAGIVALALQVAANYANDYSDGVRGTDERRVGPVRLVAGGLAAPAAVKRAAYVAFAVAGVAGLALAAAVGWQLIVVGVICIAAAWFYTGGPHPYGYAGLGELFVFVFFGLVATIGSTYVQTEGITSSSIVAAIPMGLLITAILVANNLRDIPTDTLSGKRTLAVKLGDHRTRVFYVCLIAAAFVVLPIFGALGRPLAALAFFAVIVARRPVLAVVSGARGPQLIPVLSLTSLTVLVFGALLTVGLSVSS